MAEDVLAKLPSFAWLGVSFPYSRTKLSIAHDLVEHKYWGRNGGRIEDTGVAPVRVHCSIPLFNDIIPGENEDWDPHLVPNVFDSLVLSFSTREEGQLDHPLFGRMICKADKLDIDVDAMKRSGFELEASWVHTLTDDEVANAQASAVVDIAVEAANFDTSGADLLKIVPELPKFNEDFASFMNKLAGIFDQITITSNLYANKIDQVLYRVDALSDSISRAKNASTWPVEHSLERIKERAHDLKRSAVAANRRIAVYKTVVETTLAGVQGSLPDVQVIDLIKLNPDLMRSATIPAGTNVRYYASKLPF